MRRSNRIAVSTRSRVLAAALAGILTACAAAPVVQSEPPSPGTTANLAITHVNVIDVADGVVLPDRTVLIAGDRITAVGPSRAVPVPAGARVRGNVRTNVRPGTT